MKNLSKQIEAILFLKGEEINVSKLASVTDAGKDETEAALDELENSLEGRGIRLVRNGDKVMLATAPEFAEFIKELTKAEFETDISKAALETLAIIIYKGKATRPEIDYARGVNSSYILRNLAVRGLLEKEPGGIREFIYKPSVDLLRYLGVSNLKDLPEYDNLSEKIKEIMNMESCEKIME